MKYTPIKIINGLRRRTARALKLHPSSFPYLSGDTFRTLANHIHDMDESVVPANVKNGDVVFVQSPRLAHFFSAIHPLIQSKFILITHNGDENITEAYLPYLTNTIIHWFAQNCLVIHPKITPLPIGLENIWYYLHGIPSYFDRLRTKMPTKHFRILHKFNLATNPKERGAALQVLTTHPLATTYTDWRESYHYLTTLQANAFVASPPGNGEDCIRTWEALYLGTIPILQRSAMTEHFEAHNLPILLIDDWSELTLLNEEKLRSVYATMSPKFASPALWANFWFELINSKKHDI